MIKNTYQSPHWTNELLDCSMPMTFDTYSNCSFGCLYCFSQYQRAIRTKKKDGINYTKLFGYNIGTTTNLAKFANSTTLDYFRYQWNCLTSAHSPYRMFEGVLLPDGIDEEKNIIYKYNSKVSLENYE